MHGNIIPHKIVDSTGPSDEGRAIAYGNLAVGAITEYALIRSQQKESTSDKEIHDE